MERVLFLDKEVAFYRCMWYVGVRQNSGKGGLRDGKKAVRENR